VTKELSSDGALVALNNFIIISAPDFEAIGMTRWDVTEIFS
jgi:hypothetical protein